MTALRAIALTLLLATTAIASEWRYDVREVEPGRLHVSATIPGGALSIVPGMERFVSDVRSGETKIERSGDHWLVPKCAALCNVQWSFALADAAAFAHDVELARDLGDAIESPPGTWLLRPEEDPDRVHLRVTTQSPRRFVSGMQIEGAGWQSRDFPIDVYSAFGVFDAKRIGPVDVEVIRDGHTFGSALLQLWIENAVRSIETYYGRFPTSHLLLLIRLTRGRGIGAGTAIGGGGSAISIALGEQTSREEMANDWQLTHEMVHLTFPSVARQHHWIEEGIATYVEPVAREQAGIYREEEMWGEFADGLPKGEPQRGDEGLDRTHTWGRTYWGGALFCFVADVEIRKQTANRSGLEDALRAIMRSGGTIDAEWPLDRALKIGDDATGTHVLRSLYRDMADSPHPVDLDAIFRRLGIDASREHTTLRDDAPDAATRKAITRREP